MLFSTILYISSEAFPLICARLPTSSATTEKPFPASPARAASIEALKDKIQTSEAKDLFKKIEVMGGIEVAIVEASPDSDLRKLSDLFISKHQNGAIVLYNINGDKAAVLVRSSKGAAKLNAGEALKEILAVVNGRGGGKPDMAQGSGEAALIEKIGPQAKSVLKAKLG